MAMSISPPLLVGVQIISGVVSDISKTLSMSSSSCFLTKHKLRNPVKQAQEMYFSSHQSLGLKTCLVYSQFYNVANSLLNQLSA